MLSPGEFQQQNDPKKAQAPQRMIQAAQIDDDHDDPGDSPQIGVCNLCTGLEGADQEELEGDQQESE